MLGYSKGEEEKPLTKEAIDIQRGQALEHYQGQIVVMQKELASLREETEQHLEERKGCSSELSANIQRLSEEYTTKAREIKAERDILLAELQEVKDSIRERINRRDSIQTDFSDDEETIRDTVEELTSRTLCVVGDEKRAAE